MKAPFMLVMVIVSEALVSSSGLPVMRHADLQQIARMILQYVTSRNRGGGGANGESKSEYPGGGGGGVGGHVSPSNGKNRPFKVTDLHSDDEDDSIPVDIGLTDFDDEDLLTAGSVSTRTISGSGTNYHDKRFDDYGHMRFGRNEPTVIKLKKFDDYGHMRFGK